MNKRHQEKSTNNKKGNTKMKTNIIQFPNKKKLENKQKRILLLNAINNKLLQWLGGLSGILLIVYKETLLEIAVDILKNILIINVW